MNGITPMGQDPYTTIIATISSFVNWFSDGFSAWSKCDSPGHYFAQIR